MPSEGHGSAYDRFAWLYNKYWGSGPTSFAMRALPILDRLVLSSLPSNGRLLDLCCGNGQLAAALSQRGLQVTGLDASVELLHHARQNAPRAEFVLADARTFTLPISYHGVVSLFDSLNHVMSLNDLKKVFRNVHAVLVPQGRFVFDLNMDDGYRARWRGSFGLVEEEHACVIQSAYAPGERTARMDVTMFDLTEGRWQRSDVTFLQRCYAEQEVQTALRDAGFGEIGSFDADTDLGMTGMVGRTFFRAQKP